MDYKTLSEALETENKALKENIKRTEAAFERLQTNHEKLLAKVSEYLIELAESFNKDKE